MAASNLYTNIDASLARVEGLLLEMSTALVAGEPLALEAASTTLRQAMVSLTHMVQTPAGAALLDADLRNRLDKVEQQLTQQRANLIRRAVVVDRALAAVLPQAQPQPTTYSGGGKTDVYRSGPARIYASVAS